MKIAIISDIHDNEVRLREALEICKTKSIEDCICCGDVQHFETLEMITDSFNKVYLAFGNGDYGISRNTGLIPENVEWNEKIQEISLANLKIAIVHYDHIAKKLANSDKYDVVFYGHTHTPWEKKVGNTILINPGEVAGQFGKASFAIFDTKSQKAQLFLLK